MTQAQRTMQQLRRTAMSVTRTLDDVASVGKKAAVGLAAIAAAATGVLQTTATFEKSMMRVKAVSQASVAEYKAMEKAALDMAKATQYTAQQVAEGMGYMAMAGFKSNEIIGAMPTVLRLATAGMMDLATSADIVTNILTGYGLAVEDLGAATDVLVSAMTGANVDLEMLGESFKYVGPVAKGAGVSFEVTAAAIALLGNAGIQGSMAGTSLRQALSRLLNPTKAVQDRLRKLGVQTKTATGELLPFENILAQLEKSGATAADMMEIFGDRAGPAMTALVSQGSNALMTFIDRLRESGGLAERIEKEQLNTLGGQWDILKSQIQGVAITLGQDLMPYARTLIYIGQQIVGLFDNLDASQRAQIMQWVALGGAILGIVSVLGVTAFAISAFIKGLLLLGSVVGLLTSPVVVGFTLIALAVAALKTAWDNNWLGIRDKTIEIVDAITEKWESLKTWWDTSDFGQKVREAWDRIKDVWTSDELTLPQKILKTVSIVAETIADLSPSIRAIWETWADGDLSLGQKILKTVTIVAQGVAGLVESIMTWWTGIALELVKRGATLLGLDPDDLWIVQFLEDLNDIWKSEDLSFGQKIVETIRLIPGGQSLIDFVQSIVDVWRDEELTLPQKIVETVKLVATGVTDLIESIMSWWTGAAITLTRKVATILGLDPDTLWIVGFLESLNAIWNDEELTFGQKIVKTVELLPGGKALTGFFSEIKSIWTDSSLTLPQKVVKTVSLTATRIADLIESIMAWWTGATLQLVRRGAEILGLDPDSLWVVGFLEALNNIWAEQELSFGQKIVKTIELVPGGQSLIDFVNSIGDVWENSELSLPEKAIGTVKLVVDGVTGVLEGIMIWWTDATLELTRRGATLLGLDPDNLWLTGFLGALNAIWKDADLSFGEKVVEGIKLVPGGDWVVDFFGRLKAQLFGANDVEAQIEKATGITGIADLLRAIYVAEGGADASILYGVTGFRDQGFRFAKAANQQFFDGLVEALGAEEQSRLWLAASAATTVKWYWDQFKEQHELASDAAMSELNEDMRAKWIGFLGANYAPPEAHRLNANWIKNMVYEYERQLGMADEGALTIPVQVAFDYTNETIQRLKAAFESGDFSEIVGVSADIWRTGANIAVGLTLAQGTVMSLIALIQSAFGDAGMGQSTIPGTLALVSVGVALVEALNSDGAGWKEFGKNLVTALALGIGIGAFTGSPKAGVLAFTIAVNLELGSRISNALQDEIDSLKESFQEPIDIKLGRVTMDDPTGYAKWVLEGRPVDTPAGGVYFYSGHQSGTPWTGWGPTDEIAGVVHRREAVIPWPALRKGIPGVLEFLGVPGFQEGRAVSVPGMSTAQTIVTDMNSMFRDLGKTILAGLAKLFDIIAGAIEALAVALVGEEKVAEIKAFFAEMRKGLQDYMDSLSGVESFGNVVEDAAEEVDWWTQALRDMRTVFDETMKSWVQKVPILSDAIAAYQNATTSAEEGGLGLGIAGGIAAAALAALTAGSEELNKAIEAVSQGFAALLEPINGLLRSLGRPGAGALVGAGVGYGASLLLGIASPLVGVVAGGLLGLFGGVAQQQAEAAEKQIEAANQLVQAARSMSTEARYGAIDDMRRSIVGTEGTIRDLESSIAGASALGAVGGAAAGYGAALLLGAGPLGLLIGALFGAVAGGTLASGAQQRKIEEMTAQLEAQRQALNQMIDDFKSALGITVSDLVSSVRQAFSAETAEEFSAQLETSLMTHVRNALIAGFLESAAMRPLFEMLSNQIFEAVRDGVTSAGELDAIRDTISQISDRSEQFYSVLDELGLGMKDLNKSVDSVNSALRNVPSGFKIALRRFQVADPIPLAEGGIVTRPTFAMVGERGPEAVVPLDEAGGKIVVEVHVEGSIYADDFEDRVRRAVVKGARDAGLGRYGLAGDVAWA